MIWKNPSEQVTGKVAVPVAHAILDDALPGSVRDCPTWLSASREGRLEKLNSGQKTWSGIRLGTACRLKVSDFHQDGDQATLRLHEKGDKRRTIGLHFH